jgi:LAO/AO transport system kinase
VSDAIAALASGERRPLARLLTRIERGDPSIRDLLPALFAASHGAHVVGITGPPGSGKSTLVSALIGEWRSRGRRVGVLAVDPSSPYTGGAILGDRIRMMDHAADRDVFVRSMAARGELGGLASTTWIAAAALDAARFDPILIETVGAGQSEVEIARLAETTVVVEAPEMGDEVQAIKAGLLEVADIIAVNKADRPGADLAARQLRAMLSTAGGRVSRVPPPVIKTSATTSDGVVALADAIEAHRSAARSPDQARARAANQLRRAVAEIAIRRVSGGRMVDLWQDAIETVASRTVDPMTAGESLLDSAHELSGKSRPLQRDAAGGTNGQ